MWCFTVFFWFDDCETGIHEGLQEIKNYGRQDKASKCDQKFWVHREVGYTFCVPEMSRHTPGLYGNLMRRNSGKVDDGSF
jgi:hypothetical protein